MGYYINTNVNRGKTKFIIDNYGGKLVGFAIAEIAMTDPATAVIVVMDNGLFEAAGYAFNQDEFKKFTYPDDTRRKQFILMDKIMAEKLSGYDRRNYGK